MLSNNDKEIKDLTISVTDVRLDEPPSNESIAQSQARKFIEKIKGGKKPHMAAQDIGTTLKKIKNSEEMKEALAELYKTATIGEEMRKLMVKNSLNKILMENYDSQEPKKVKLALDAAKLISNDPDVGLSSKEPSVSISFNSGLEDRLKDIDFEVKK